MKPQPVITALSLAASFIATGQVVLSEAVAEEPLAKVAAADAESTAVEGEFEESGQPAEPAQGGNEETRRRGFKAGGFTSRVAGIGGDPSVRWTYVDGGQLGRGLATPLDGPQTYLGVAASPVSAELSSQLDLPANTGLVINHIEKNSPAGKAGLQAGDVLAKLDDQILILPQQLSVLIAGKKENESVKLTFLRKGQSHEVTAVLVTRSLPGAKGVFRIGDADVVIDAASLEEPIRTFTKQLGTHPALRTPPNPAPAENGDVQERVKKIEAALEELKAALAK